MTEGARPIAGLHCSFPKYDGVMLRKNVPPLKFTQDSSTGEDLSESDIIPGMVAVDSASRSPYERIFIILDKLKDPEGNLVGVKGIYPRMKNVKKINDDGESICWILGQDLTTTDKVFMDECTCNDADGSFDAFVCECGVYDKLKKDYQNTFKEVNLDYAYRIKNILLANFTRDTSIYACYVKCDVDWKDYDYPYMTMKD